MRIAPGLPCLIAAFAWSSQLFAQAYPGKPVGSCHGDSVGVHASDSMNAWRNIAAHQGTPSAAAGPLAFPLVQDWRNSCDGLATSLDGILYNELRKILRRAPW